MIKLITISFLSALYTLAQVPVGRVVICTDAGASDTYTCTPSPAISSYTTGLRVTLYANTANTGAATVNINALGAKTIKKLAGGVTTDLSDNDIRSGQYVDLVYDGTNFQMLSQLGATASSGGGITAWAPTTSYTTGQQVYKTSTENSTAHTVFWRAGTNCTSGASFDATEISNCQWIVIAGTALMEEYTSSSGSPFTWNKPLGARAVTVCVIGSGGGGGSGARQATGTQRGGGGGGGAGGRSCATFEASQISSTVSITVGAGATGNAGKTVDSSNGSAGGSGNTSSFGVYLKATGGGGGGGGQTGAGGTAGAAGTGLTSNGGAGNTGGATSNGTTGQVANFSSSGGGGGGGAAASSTATANGGNGGANATFANSAVTAGSGGTTGPTAATQGTCDDVAMICAGSGGGYYITAVAGGTGANGLKYGAGGGGGGASDNGNTSGAGGNGADGAVRIITVF